MYRDLANLWKSPEAIDLNTHPRVKKTFGYLEGEVLDFQVLTRAEAVAVFLRLRPFSEPGPDEYFLTWRGTKGISKIIDVLVEAYARQVAVEGVPMSATRSRGLWEHRLGMAPTRSMEKEVSICALEGCDTRALPKDLNAGEIITRDHFQFLVRFVGLLENWPLLIDRAGKSELVRPRLHDGKVLLFDAKGRAVIESLCYLASRSVRTAIPWKKELLEPLLCPPVPSVRCVDSIPEIHKLIRLTGTQRYLVEEKGIGRFMSLDHAIQNGRHPLCSDQPKIMIDRLKHHFPNHDFSITKIGRAYLDTWASILTA